MAEYIEREAAVCVCANQYKECLRKSDWCGDTVAWNIGFAIKAIPAADVAPVRHGRWEPVLEYVWNILQPVSVGWRCSECGRTEQAKEPYCNCGAKMDLEGGDGDGQRF